MRVVSIRLEVFRHGTDGQNGMEDTVMTQLGLSGDEEGVKATVKVDGTGMKMDIHVDLMKADSKVLNKFSITGNTKNVKLSETVENAEKGQEGIKFTCK